MKSWWVRKSDLQMCEIERLSVKWDNCQYSKWEELENRNGMKLSIVKSRT